jgi:galactokinase
MRVKHVIYENQRVLGTVEAIKEKDFARVGKYLTESHNSLRDLYEVSSKELDTLVEAATGVNGCLGARLTGAGFGGCVISLIRKDVYEEFKNIVTENYYKVAKIYPEIFPVSVVNGVEKIEDSNS